MFLFYLEAGWGFPVYLPTGLPVHIGCYMCWPKAVHDFPCGSIHLHTISSDISVF